MVCGDGYWPTMPMSVILVESDDWLNEDSRMKGLCRGCELTASVGLAVPVFLGIAFASWVVFGVLLFGSVIGMAVTYVLLRKDRRGGRAFIEMPEGWAYFDGKGVGLGKTKKEAEEDLRKQAEEEYRQERMKMKHARWKLQGVTRKATPNEYRRWLGGYLSRGGKNLKIEDETFRTSADEWFLLEEDVELPGLYGTEAVSLLVPKGISVSGERGHCDILYMDGYRTEGVHRVPVYREMQRML